jgi:DMSO/TMAO reductase YedYZ molybdopterin-dependent catalytic subunit
LSAFANRIASSSLRVGKIMEPENEKPEPKSADVSSPASKPADPAMAKQEATPSNSAQPEVVPPAPKSLQPEPLPVESSQVAPTRIVGPTMTQRKFGQVSRRELLKLAPVLALGAFAVPSFQEGLLKKGLAFSDWASARLYRRGHLATTFADSELTPFEKFPINGYDVEDPGVIFENWTLTVGGAVQKPGDYTLAQIQSLPKMRHNTRHVCVEGWDVIGRFGGARLSDFLSMIGADTTARFLTVTCADDYYESIDMATALHPQTLLCYEMYDQPLTRKHGAPLRLNIPTKVGYKQAKYLTNMSVANVLEKVGYWEDQGYSEFYGL